MNRVVKKRKKTLFGKIIRKIESELASQQVNTISSKVPLDYSKINEAELEKIQKKREELKASKNINTDITFSKDESYSE